MTISSKKQLKWVIPLLMMAVVLPTICLLWFMTQAVKNERLAVKQKLINVYTKRAQAFFVDFPDSYWNDTKSHLSSSKTLLSHTSLFPTLFAGKNFKRFNGFIIFDKDGQLEYPVIQKYKINNSSLIEPLKKATDLEFKLSDIPKALTEYRKLTNEPNKNLQLTARIGEIRCLAKLNLVTEAIEKCDQLSYPEIKDINDYPYASQVMRMRVKLANLYKSSDDPNLYYHLRRCLTGSHYNNEKKHPAMLFPTEINIWGLTKLSEIATNAGLDKKLQRELADAQGRINIEETSSLISQYYNNTNFVSNWPKATIRKLNLPKSIKAAYGIHYQIYGKTILCIINKEFISWFTGIILSDWTDDTVVCKIKDDKGNFIAGEKQIETKPFAEISLGRFFPEWTAQLYFRNAEVFDNAASKQAAIYTWTGILIVLLILVSCIMAAQVIGKQIKLYKLKNNFIATVTHELKTPLSSMRVLVDTLLDGNYKDSKTAKEYLHLISKENQRLTHLIDNFLTFSRMERNKQAFDLTKTSPVIIAESAADAMMTKFNNSSKCKFDMEIEKNLPDIYADKDAMVTVLVNLLDNAYKYSSDKKQITLRVFKTDNQVSFSVKDNGIGMNKRQIRKIFNRFYQADNSLTRKTQGTGLGLSIVKFIVDAHKGKIEIKSQPGKGSEFILSLSHL